MSVTTISETTPAAMRSGHYRLLDLVKSEWTKLRTVRSTMWTIAVTIVLGIGVSALVTAETRAHWSSVGSGNHFGFDPTQTSLIGILIAQFSIGVLGVLAISAEYSTGTIRATLSAAPKRSHVYAAKIVVFGLLSLIVAEFTSFASFFLGQFLLSAPARHATLSSPGALRAVFGGGLFVCVLGLIALGLGTIIRHTAGAVSAFVGMLLIVPLIVQALPYQIAFDVRKFLPDRIGVHMITTQGQEFHQFGAWTGMFILCLYAAGLLLIGLILLERRDA